MRRAAHPGSSCASFCFEHFLGARRAPGGQPFVERGVGRGQNLSRKQRRVGRAGLADRQRAHRNALRHLHNREQRIQAVQLRGRNRNSEHRNQRLGRQHARQMRCAAGSGDDHAQAALARRLCVFEEPVRRAMRAHDARLMRNLERAQNLHGRREHFVVALAAHHHAHQRLFAHGADYTR